MDTVQTLRSHWRSDGCTHKAHVRGSQVQTRYGEMVLRRKLCLYSKGHSASTWMAWVSLDR